MGYRRHGRGIDRNGGAGGGCAVYGLGFLFLGLFVVWVW